MALQWYPHTPARDAQHVDGLSPERHFTKVISAGGYWWGICSCDSLSLPFDTGGAASQWSCPRDVAEQEIYIAREAWAVLMGARHADPRD
jgi:hypothetical protein